MVTRRYILYGFALGLLFPVLASAVELTILLRHGWGPWEGLVHAQRQPLMWIIWLAPAVLALAGARLGSVQEAYSGLERYRQDQVLGTAGDLTRAAETLLTSVSSFSSTAAQTAATVRESTATMTQLGHTATRAALTAETVIGLAERSQRTADEGVEAAAASTAEMERLAAEVRGLATGVEALNARMRDIFEVASVVNYVADRSQRLAESAADEAQRSGGLSDGLAGVVGEMRLHADDAKRAALQVKTVLAEVHRAMLAALTAAEIGVRRAEQGAQVAAGTGEAIRRLAAALRESSEAAREIATVAQQQDRGIDQVLQAMNEIYQAAQETMASTHQVAGEARALNELAVGLKQQVEGGA
jgi:methyl-accepting chemotaxis protein